MYPNQTSNPQSNKSKNTTQIKLSTLSKENTTIKAMAGQNKALIATAYIHNHYLTSNSIPHRPEVNKQTITRTPKYKQGLTMPNIKSYSSTTMIDNLYTILLILIALQLTILLEDDALLLRRQQAHEPQWDTQSEEEY